LRKGLDHRLVLAVLEWCKTTLGVVAYRYASGALPGRKKPAPGMLLELMNELDFTPSQTIFIGDTMTDEQAATAAGVEFVWATDFIDLLDPAAAHKDRLSTQIYLEASK
jgi:phosphoglycolate phosphatase-like HAD superfamily hydrolase